VCHCRVRDVATEQDAEEHPAPSPLCVIVVCGMSPPNRTLKNIEHRVHCVSSCNHGCPSRCQAVNYWKTAKLCQLFYYEPCSYDTQDDCVIYQVIIACFNVEQRTLFFSRLLNADAQLLAIC